MKKITIVRSMLIAAVAAVLVSCTSAPAASANTAKKSSADTTQAIPEPKVAVNYSSLSPEQEGSELTITGLFSKGADGSAALITNPESRSRVTFVLADPQGVLEAAALEDGSMITVTGILTEASATWRKHLDVITVN